MIKVTRAQQCSLPVPPPCVIEFLPVATLSQTSPFHFSILLPFSATKFSLFYLFSPVLLKAINLKYCFGFSSDYLLRITSIVCFYVSLLGQKILLCQSVAAFLISQLLLHFKIHFIGYKVVQNSTRPEKRNRIASLFLVGFIQSPGH